MNDTDRDAVERLAQAMLRQGCRWRVGDAESEQRARNCDIAAETLRTLLAAKEGAEAEAAALREKLRDNIKHLHAQLPYFNVPHIREGLEDMLDVIGPMEGDSDDG